MQQLKSGHTVEEITKEEREKFRELFPIMDGDMVRLQPGGWMSMRNYVPFADSVYEFKIRPTDVMILSFPKSGTMWMAELVWNMMLNKNFDNKFHDVSLMFKVPCITNDQMWQNDLPMLARALKTMHPNMKESNSMMLDSAAQLPDPRVLRSHAPLSLLPKNMLDTCKVICIARNPKDVLPSFRHHWDIMKSFKFTGDMDDIVDLLVTDDIILGPYWGMYKEIWNQRHHPNLHWIYYEDMKADNFGEMQRLDTFLGTNLGDVKLAEIKEYNSFANMKKRDPIFGAFTKDGENSMIKTGSQIKHNFFRKGIAGGWKNELTVAQNEKIDAWIEKNSADTDLRMKY